MGDPNETQGIKGDDVSDLPPPPAPEPLNLKDMCDAIRAELLGVEKTVRAFKGRPECQGPDAYPGQHGEMVAQSMLAVRHLEDARMRIGKVLQYARDGVSILDKA